MQTMKQFFETLSNSYLFDQARSGRRTVHWALIVPALLVILFGGLSAGVLLLRATGLVPDGVPVEDSTAPGWLLLTVLFLPSWILTALWVRFYEKRPALSAGLSRPGGGKRLIGGMVIGIGLMSLVVVINWAAGGYTLDPVQQTTPSGSILLVILLLLAAFTIQGGAEELVLRGWLMPVIGARYNRTAAILLPLILFVLLHGMPEGRPAYSGFGLFLFTAAMTLWALRDGDIARAIGVHAGWNWAAGQLFGLNISNSSWGSESLLKVSQTGGTVLSGGTGGPEWSLATLFVWGGCCAWLVYTVTRSGVYRPGA